MKKIFFILFAVIAMPVFAADAPVPPAPSAPRVSLFSTTVDWHGVTGLPLSQYAAEFTGKNLSLIKQGLILYYLDAFPCYGEADSVRTWISPNGTADGAIRLVCVHTPKTISFAYRNANRDAIQAETTGILTCPVRGDYNITIDLSKCERGPDWDEYQK